MKLEHQEFTFPVNSGEYVRCDVRYLKNGIKKPVILFIHGFKGFKDWGGFPYVRTRLAEGGFFTIGINFSHNGIGKDLQEFTELDKFAANTFTGELAELSEIIALVSSASLPTIELSEYDKETILLLGHSRGAAEAILATANHLEVKAACAWAPIALFDRYTERQRKAWKEKGYFEIENARTGQLMRLNASLLDDIDQHPKELDIPLAAKAIRQTARKLLVIAGREDLTAPVKESEEIVSQYGDASNLIVISNTGHTFGATHPFTGTTPALETALTATIDFFKSINN